MTLGGKEVVAQSGSRMNLAGGTLDVAEGVINLSWLRGRTLVRSLQRAGGPGLRGPVPRLRGRPLGREATRRFLNPVLAPSTRARPATRWAGTRAGWCCRRPPPWWKARLSPPCTTARARRAGAGRRLGQSQLAVRAGGLALGNTARWAGSTSSIPTSSSAATPISPWRWRRATRWRPSASAPCGWTAGGCPTWAWALDLATGGALTVAEVVALADGGQGR